MYAKILVAVDPSGGAARLAAAVAALADGPQTAVRVVGVIAGGPPTAAVAGGTERLNEVASALGVGGIRAEVRLRHLAAGRSVAAEIVAETSEWSPDLVVMGSRGRSELAALLVGSVSRDVVAALHIPVLLLPAGGRSHIEGVRARRILVPVDRSQHSAEALLAAVDLAQSLGARLLLLHVRQMVAWGEVSDIESEEEASQLLAAARPKVPAGLAIETRIGNPDLSPAGAIVRAADEWGADLIVLGSHRPGAWGGLLLGSVAHGVVRRAQVPVLIAGTGDQTAPGENAPAAV